MVWLNLNGRDDMKTDLYQFYCSAAKAILEYRAKAEELYTGQLFQIFKIRSPNLVMEPIEVFRSRRFRFIRPAWPYTSIRFLEPYEATP